MKRLILIFLSLVITEITLGQSKDTPCSRPSGQQVSSLCADVNNRLVDEDENSRYDWRFQKLLEELACVDPIKDNADVVKRKVQEWWNKYHDDCKCSRTNFLLVDGNILKYAAQNGFLDFFLIITDRYGFNLNFIDPVDGKTVLDFLIDEYEILEKRAPGDKNAKSWLGTIKILKKYGAKRAKEL